MKLSKLHGRFAWHASCFCCARFKNQGAPDTIGKAYWTGRARPGIGTGGDELADHIGLRTAALRATRARRGSFNEGGLYNKQESK